MKVWNAGDFILHTDLNANFATLANSAGIGVATLNVLSYAQPGDADSTLAFTRAFAAAQALNTPVQITVPAGLYVISAALAFTLTGNQAIRLTGAGAGVTIIKQTADANGLALQVNNYGPAFFLGGTVGVTGLTFQMAATASTTRTALSIATNGTNGFTGPPVVVDDVTITSTTTTAAWGVGLNLFAVNDLTYVSRLSIIFAGNGTGPGTGIVLGGANGAYCTGIFMRDLSVFGALTGLVIGAWVQGVVLTNYNSVNNTNSITCTPAASTVQGIIISDSYLDGKTLFAASGTGTINEVRITTSFIDCDVLANNDRHIAFIGVSQLTFAGNFVHGTGGRTTGNVGLYIGTATGQTNTGQTLVEGNTIYSYSGTGGVGLSIGTGAASIFCSGNSFVGNTLDISDLGTATNFINTQIAGAVSHVGIASSIPTATATFFGPVTVQGGNLATSGSFFAAAGVNSTAVGNTAPGTGAFTTLAVGAAATAATIVEIGSTTTAATTAFDLHSSGNNTDYDVRLQASGGTGSAGQGMLTILALVPAAANDAAAATAGVLVGGLYRIGSALQIRVV